MSNEVSPNDHDKRTVLTERRGSTLLVTINRPEQWSLSWEEALGNEARRGLAVLR